MLFLALPDDDALGEDSKEKALLDTEELAGDDFVPEGMKDKVELDLEDAPFLEEEEEEEEAPSKADEPLPVAVEAPSKGLKDLLREHRKVVLIGGGAGGVLLILLLVLLLLPGSEPGPAPVPEDIPAQLPPEEIPPEEEGPEEIIISWEPFWVELQTDDGEVRFLYCKFSSSTTDNLLAREVIQKNVVLRDAIFYYLRNKDVTFLTDENNAEALKEGLLGALNNHLSSGKLYVLLIEDYLVK